MSVGAPIYGNPCSRNRCKHEVLKYLWGKYCDKFIGKKNCVRECMSLKGLGVSERMCRWDCKSTSGLQIGNRIEDGKRMGRKKDCLDPLLYIGW